MIRLGRLERYVLVQTLRSLAVALGVISAVIMLIDFVEISRGIGGDADLSALQLLGLMVLKSPSTILELLPFVFLFGTLAAFVGLNRRSELIAMRAAGISAWRFVLPAGFAALAIGLVVVTVINPFASWADGLYERQEQRLSGGTATSPAEAIWLREGSDDRQMVIRAESQDRRMGLFRNVSFFIYQGQGPQRGFTERVDAATATLSAGRWRLTDAVSAVSGEQATQYATLDLRSDLTEQEAFEQFSAPDSTPFWSLPAQISRIEAAGFTSTAHRLRLQQLLATPLLFAAMSMLAAAFSLRLMRLGDLARMSVAAVLLGFGFFFVNQFAAAYGSAEVIPPFLAAWLPPVLATLSALTLLFYTEDG